MGVTAAGNRGTVVETEFKGTSKSNDHCYVRTTANSQTQPMTPGKRGYHHISCWNLGASRKIRGRPAAVGRHRQDEGTR